MDSVPFDHGDQLRGYYSCHTKSQKFYKYMYFKFLTVPEEVGHDAHLRYSHMTLVCNYAATRSKECHLRV